MLPLMPSAGWDLPGGEQGGQQEAAGCAEPLLGKCWPPPPTRTETQALFSQLISVLALM